MKHYQNMDIRLAILEHNMNMAQFAKILGISRPQICNLMKSDLSEKRKNAMLKAIEGDLSEWKKIYNKQHIYCEKCKRGLLRSYNYCPYCGTEVSE